MRALSALLSDLSLHKTQQAKAEKKGAQWMTVGAWRKLQSLAALPLDSQRQRLQLALLLRHLYALSFKVTSKDNDADSDTVWEEEREGEEEGEDEGEGEGEGEGEDDDDDDDNDDEGLEKKVDPDATALSLYNRFIIMRVRDGLDDERWTLPEVRVPTTVKPKKKKTTTKEPPQKKPRAGTVKLKKAERTVGWKTWKQVSLLPQPSRLSSAVRLERFCWGDLFPVKVSCVCVYVYICMCIPPSQPLVVSFYF